MTFWFCFYQDISENVGDGFYLYILKNELFTFVEEEKGANSAHGSIDSINSKGNQYSRIVSIGS